MPKKNVGVSLRKPPPAPEEPFASAGEAALAPAHEDRATEPPPVDIDSFVLGKGSSDSLTAGAGVDEGSPQRHSCIVERVTARADESPTTRDEDTLHASGAGSSEPTPPEASRPSRQELPSNAVGGTHAGGYREVVVYLPVGLARRLSLHCAQRNTDISRFVREALEARLNPASTGGAGPRGNAARLQQAARRSARQLALKIRASIEPGGTLRLWAPTGWMGEVLAQGWLPARLLGRLQNSEN